MRIEEADGGARALVFLPDPVDAAAGRAVEDALRALPDTLSELVLVLDPDARITDDALPPLTRLVRALVRRRIRGVFVSNRALQRDRARRILADAGDARGTVTVSQEIAEQWLSDGRERRRRRRRDTRDTLTQMKAVQTRMRSLRDSADE